MIARRRGEGIGSERRCTAWLLYGAVVNTDSLTRRLDADDRRAARIEAADQAATASNLSSSSAAPSFEMLPDGRQRSLPRQPTTTPTTTTPTLPNSDAGREANDRYDKEDQDDKDDDGEDNDDDDDDYNYARRRGDEDPIVAAARRWDDAAALRERLAPLIERVHRDTGVELDVDWLPYDGKMTARTADAFDVTFVHALSHSTAGFRYSYRNIGDTLAPRDDERRAVRMFCDALRLTAEADDLLIGYTLMSGTVGCAVTVDAPVVAVERQRRDRHQNSRASPSPSPSPLAAITTNATPPMPHTPTHASGDSVHHRHSARRHHARGHERDSNSDDNAARRRHHSSSSSSSLRSRDRVAQREPTPP